MSYLGDAVHLRPGIAETGSDIETGCARCKIATFPTPLIIWRSQVPATRVSLAAATTSGVIASRVLMARTRPIWLMSRSMRRKLPPVIGDDVHQRLDVWFVFRVEDQAQAVPVFGEHRAEVFGVQRQVVVQSTRVSDDLDAQGRAHPTFGRTAAPVTVTVTAARHPLVRRR